jgi:hypothetical protein
MLRPANSDQPSFNVETQVTGQSLCVLETCKNAGYQVKAVSTAPCFMSGKERTVEELYKLLLIIFQERFLRLS